MRKFLKTLNLNSKVINLIMIEHGKLVTKDKEKIKKLEGEIKNANIQIISMKKSIRYFVSKRRKDEYRRNESKWSQSNSSK